MVKKANCCKQGQKSLSRYSLKKDVGELQKRTEGILNMEISMKAKEV
jgi:hypothetical protein